MASTAAPLHPVAVCSVDTPQGLYLGCLAPSCIADQQAQSLGPRRNRSRIQILHLIRSFLPAGQRFGRF
jgi:hypothetical protein